MPRSWSRSCSHWNHGQPFPAALIACLWSGCEGQEINHPGLHTVHRPGDLHGARGFELGDDGTTTVDPGHGELDILPSDRVNEDVVLRRALALIRGGIHRRLDLREQAGEVAELDPIDGALDRTARRVPHHQHDLRTGYLACEFHTTEDVVVGDVGGHARVEAVADPQVHDRLGGRARGNATDDSGLAKFIPCTNLRLDDCIVLGVLSLVAAPRAVFDY